MPVYALYIPTAGRPVTGVGMERFASRELAGRVLKERNATKRSRSFCIDVPRPVSGSGWPEAKFPDADKTGYMRVFLRYAADPAPSLLDTPDEEWIVREGGRTGVVERLPWSRGDERVVVKRGRLSVTPKMARAVPSVLKERTVRCARPSCPLVFTGSATDGLSFEKLYMQHGWCRRGSVTGVIHFCPRHAS